MNTSSFSEELKRDFFSGKSFYYGNLLGQIYGRMTLAKTGEILGYNNCNEEFWCFDEGILYLKDYQGNTTSMFSHFTLNPILAAKGLFLSSGYPCILTASSTKLTDGIVSQLTEQLYSGAPPCVGIDKYCPDNDYPHTNLQQELVDIIIHQYSPTFWLEIGSMLGGSALLVARRAQHLGSMTGIVCVDPFVGDVNMWAWERSLFALGEWRFLKLENGIPTIYNRFLSNISREEFNDAVLPIQATSIVGINLLRRLFTEKRISMLPEVIYLDSAHEEGETLLELQASWSLLRPGGILFGDDWDWAPVRRDVTRFMLSLAIGERRENYYEKFSILNIDLHEGVAVYNNHWIICKPID